MPIIARSFIKKGKSKIKDSKGQTVRGVWKNGMNLSIQKVTNQEQPR